MKSGEDKSNNSASLGSNRLYFSKRQLQLLDFMSVKLEMVGILV
jgi:hypothetical protein